MVWILRFMLCISGRTDKFLGRLFLLRAFLQLPLSTQRKMNSINSRDFYIHIWACVCVCIELSERVECFIFQQYFAFVYIFDNAPRFGNSMWKLA